MKEYKSFIELYDHKGKKIEGFYLVHNKETLTSLKESFRTYLSLFDEEGKAIKFKLWFAVNGEKLATSTAQTISRFLKVEVKHG